MHSTSLKRFDSIALLIAIQECGSSFEALTHYLGVSYSFSETVYVTSKIGADGKKFKDGGILIPEYFVNNPVKVELNM